MNTIAKRFSEIKRRYNLNIQTTAAGYHPPKKVVADKIVKRSRGRPARREAGTTDSAKKNAIKKHLEDDEAAFNFEQFVNAEAS